MDVWETQNEVGDVAGVQRLVDGRFQTSPSSWQSEGVLPPLTGEVIKSEGTMPSAETELAEKEETKVREKGDVRESEKERDGTKGIRDTVRVTEQPKMKVGFRDTVVGSMEPEVDIRDSIQRERAHVQKEEGRFLGRGAWGNHAQGGRHGEGEDRQRE